MPKLDDELQYINAVKWIHENPQDKRISDEIKENFLCFNTLLPKNKIELLITLCELSEKKTSPLEIEKSLPWLMFDLDALPNELLMEIKCHLKNNSDKGNLASTSRRMYHLFQPKRLLDKFLERVAFRMQDTVEALFTNLYKGHVEKVQEALRYRGKFTDYSGRKFNCTAYEYAYWARDTHMCRMLEHYMDDVTKAQMLACINEIERFDEKTKQPVGLRYQQNDAEHRSAHFDLTPLITALREFIEANNFIAIEEAWGRVGQTQRHVPAHVLRNIADKTVRLLTYRLLMLIERIYPKKYCREI